MEMSHLLVDDKKSVAISITDTENHASLHKTSSHDERKAKIEVQRLSIEEELSVEGHDHLSKSEKTSEINNSSG